MTIYDASLGPIRIIAYYYDGGTMLHRNGCVIFDGQEQFCTDVGTCVARYDSMRERITKTIDGVDFAHTQLGAREGRKILVMLTKTVGPGLAKLVGDTDPGKVSSAISDAVRDLSSSLTTQDLETLCDAYGRHTEISMDGKLVQLTVDVQDLVFAGKYGTMLKWLWFCTEVNFSSFFAMLGIEKGPQ